MCRLWNEDKNHLLNEEYEHGVTSEKPVILALSVCTKSRLK